MYCVLTPVCNIVCSHCLHCRCVCVSGQTAADGKSCVDPAGFLMVSGNKKIGFSPLNPLIQPPPPFSPITRRLGNVVGLEADFESELIYFAETRGRKGTIKAVYLNGTGMRVVVGGMLKFMMIYVYALVSKCAKMAIIGQVFFFAARLS